MPRRPRLLSPITRTAIMRAADVTRRAAAKVCTEAPIGSAEYKASARVLEALGNLAGVLGGAAPKTGG